MTHDFEEVAQRVKKTSNQIMNDFYRLVIETTSDYVSIIDMEGRFLYVNNAHKKLGYNPEDLTGKSGFSIVHPDDKKRLLPLLISSAKDIAGNKAENFLKKKKIIEAKTLHYKIQDSGGKWHYLESTANVTENPIGKGYVILLVSKDISDRENLMKEAAAEKEKERLYLDVANVIMLALDSTGKITLANRKCTEVLGLKESEILGKNWFDNFIPKKDRKEVQNVFENILNGKENSREVHKNFVVTADGKEKFIEWHNAVMTDANGNIVGTVSSGNDITDQKKTEEDIIKIKMGVEKSEDVIFITDVEGKITYANHAFEKLYGYTSSEFTGKTPRILKSGAQANGFYKELWENLSSKKNVNMDITNKTKKGKMITVNMSAAPILDKNEKIIGFIAIQKDVSERKKSEDELMRKNDELESLNKLAVGRELRMVELKKRIKELEEKVSKDSAKFGASV